MCKYLHSQFRYKLEAIHSQMHHASIPRQVWSTQWRCSETFQTGRFLELILLCKHDQGLGANVCSLWELHWKGDENDRNLVTLGPLCWVLWSWLGVSLHGVKCRDHLFYGRIRHGKDGMESDEHEHNSFAGNGTIKKTCLLTWLVKS